ncbi:MAG: GNAT family N-acetyltransferase [Planctomycetes bacterium]|nr:GNAT family N-acetyltransferase [Planctomycetota bacterium]MCR4318221.1 GNAT family N-acetyltransferase [Planctomycetota bacterium]
MGLPVAIPNLETSRLILRPFELSDAADVQRLAGDYAIAEMTAHIPHPYPEGAAAEWISTHRKDFDTCSGVALAITLKETGELLGAIGLMDIQKEHQAEVGYWIGKPFCGNGYCTEAARAVIDFAFTTLGLIRVHAHHMSKNPASGRVLLKAGMMHEGSRRKHMFRWGKLEDIEMYGILKTEFLSV